MMHGILGMSNTADDMTALQLGNSQDSEDSNRTQHVSIMGPPRSPDDIRNKSSTPELPPERHPQVSPTKSIKEPMKCPQTNTRWQQAPTLMTGVAYDHQLMPITSMLHMTKAYQ